MGHESLAGKAHACVCVCVWPWGGGGWAGNHATSKSLKKGKEKAEINAR